MGSKIDVVMEICAQLAEQENLGVTVLESAKGAGVVGITTLLGGLLGGKSGLLIGGAIGSAASYFITSDFKSLPNIIRQDMTESQRRNLYQRVNVLLKGVKINNAASVMAFLSTHAAVKQNVLWVLADYLKNELGIKI